MAKEEVGKAAGDLPTEIEEHKSNDSVIIEIPERLDRELWSKCCILRVHTKLRKVNDAAYTPQILSIGPFHHGKKELLGMEPHKRRYLDEFCKRFGKNQVELRLFICDHREEILQSFAGSVKVKGEAFIEMVLVDACFIIELFLRNSEEREDDYILNTPWLCMDIVLDLIMLENQLPYAFLKQLYDFVATLQPPYWEAIGDSGAEIELNPERVPLLSSQHHNKNSNFHPFLKLTHDFFYDAKDIGEESEVDGIKHFTDLARQKLCPKQILPSQDSRIEIGEESEVNGLKHLTELVRVQVLSSKKNLPSDNGMSSLYSAKKLDLAGVQFVLSENPRLAELEIESSNLVCAPFLKSRRLFLPEFFVTDDTECHLRNVMALEQCLYPDKSYICNYICLLDKLINNAEDVELLVEKKIVRNFLGSNTEVAKLVNKLCEEIVVDDLCYKKVCEELNGHCINSFNRTKAMIKRVYFKDYWTASTALFGLCVMVFSVSATIKGLFF